MNTKVLTDEQKAKFVNNIIEYGTAFVAPLFSVVESIEQAVLQSEQVQAWKKDAERYQCLRDHAEIGPGNVFNAWWLHDHGNPSTLDEALDIAIKEQP